MRKTLLIGCSAILGLFLLTMLASWLFVAPDWEVTATRTVKAPATSIHASVADLQGWKEWTAWGKEAGEDATWSYEGAPAGSGAVMRWNTQRTGPGTLTIVKADPTGIEYEMVFGDGEGPSSVTGTVSYRPVEGGTEVVWTDRGSFGWNPALRLVKGLFVKAYGEGLEACLEGLAERVEPAGA